MNDWNLDGGDDYMGESSFTAEGGGGFLGKLLNTDPTLGPGDTRLLGLAENLMQGIFIACILWLLVAVLSKSSTANMQSAASLTIITLVLNMIVSSNALGAGVLLGTGLSKLGTMFSFGSK